MSAPLHEKFGLDSDGLYVGYYQDKHGLTQVGRIILDAWVFDILPESEDGRGLTMGEIQTLMRRVEKEWDKYGLPSRLPPELQERHHRIYEQAMRRARERGWNPELDEEEG